MSVPIRPNDRDEQNRIWLYVLIIGYVLGVGSCTMDPQPAAVCAQTHGRVCSDHFFYDNDQGDDQ